MSSISVYRTKNSTQKQGEDLLLELKNSVLILRLGGLMGESRVAGKWKNPKPMSDGYVNYIHQKDVIGIVKKTIENEIVNGIYNLVAPKHPLRSEVHKKNAKDFGFELGCFEGKTNRIVSADKITKELNYKFLYPNPLYMWS